MQTTWDPMQNWISYVATTYQEHKPEWRDLEETAKATKVFYTGMLLTDPINHQNLSGDECKTNISSI